MTKRMLIDATHPEETRVVVLNGNKLEEFDFETSTKKQLKGNIYLAKVTRVEPSLQAAFVEYGGNRHGFLAFNEIHPDYWRIPVADREALLAEQAASDNGDEEEPRRHRRRERREPDGLTETGPEQPDQPQFDTQPSEGAGAPPADIQPAELQPYEPPADQFPRSFALDHDSGMSVSEPAPVAADDTGDRSQPDTPADAPPSSAELPAPWSADDAQPAPAETTDLQSGEVAAPVERTNGEGTSVESIGGDDMDEVETRRRHRPLRHYKIQEVIKRRQVLLVQVVKEERGTKGAALTTYLSLAGRYCVLMPNTARGGGISRRITSAQDRKRLKSIMEELNLPEGTAVILRTAGMERSKPEIKRDYEYLQRQWDDIRELTLKSTAPCLVYEEGSLIKRAIRDLYARDIDDILVEGEEGYKVAKNFMKTLMPSHTGRIQLYNDPTVPLFQRFQVEAQLDEMHSPTVRLRSGGYIVINPTEALVSIDVNSGRATRERHIEETAYKTNLEAADEIARQLRLRDLAGLIVIDFIDMEDSRNQHAVERRLKEAMKSDRARIQIGRISPFGLLELSRQRLRPSLQEVSTDRCPHCGGTGLVRSTESTALHVLRAIEEEGMKMRTVEATVHVPTSIAIYILNQKRDTLVNIETRYGLRVAFSRDDTLIPPAYRLDRTRARAASDPLPAQPVLLPPPAEIDQPMGEGEAEADAMPAEAHDHEPAYADEQRGEARDVHGDGDGEDGHRRRRRRRRRGRGRDGDDRAPIQPHIRDHHPHHPQHPPHEPGAVPAEAQIAEPGDHAEGGADTGEGAGAAAGPHQGPEHRHRDHPHEQGDGDARRRRRGRRGGRRRGRRGPDQIEATTGQDPFADPRYRDAVPGGHEPAEHAAEPHEDRRAAEPHADHYPQAEPPLRRIEGPGDAYDWPWNRRAERFPDEVAREQEAASESAATGHPSEPRQESAPPAPLVQQPPAPQEPERHEPAREPEMAAQPAEPRQATPQAPPEPETPAGPPRKGWWRRLTQ